MVIWIPLLCDNDAVFQISSSLDIRNLFKITPVFHLLDGSVEDCWCQDFHLWWLESLGYMIEMLCFKFHQVWRSGTSSRLPQSSISRMVLWRTVGVKYLIWISVRSNPDVEQQEFWLYNFWQLNYEKTKNAFLRLFTRQRSRNLLQGLCQKAPTPGWKFLHISTP